MIDPCCFTSTRSLLHRMPTVMTLIGFCTFFNLWSKCLSLCGAQRFAFDDEENDDVDELLGAGRCLVDAEQRASGQTIHNNSSTSSAASVNEPQASLSAAERAANRCVFIVIFSTHYDFSMTFFCLLGDEDTLN